MKPVKKEADTFEIVAVFTNEGFLPTALKMAERVKIVRPDAASVRLPAGVELVGVRARQDIGFINQNERKEVRWKVKVKPGNVGRGRDLHSLDARRRRPDHPQDRVGPLGPEGRPYVFIL